MDGSPNTGDWFARRLQSLMCLKCRDHTSARLCRTDGLSCKQMVASGATILGSSAKTFWNAYSGYSNATSLRGTRLPTMREPVQTGTILQRQTETRLMCIGFSPCACGPADIIFMRKVYAPITYHWLFLHHNTVAYCTTSANGHQSLIALRLRDPGVNLKRLCDWRALDLCCLL